MLPIGQLLWEKELMSYKTFPPLQAPETYNLDGILKEIQAAITTRATSRKQCEVTSGRPQNGRPQMLRGNPLRDPSPRSAGRVVFVWCV